MPGMAESHSSGALPQAAGAGATLGVATELWPWAEQGWVARMGTGLGEQIRDTSWYLPFVSRVAFQDWGSSSHKYTFRAQEP